MRKLAVFSAIAAFCGLFSAASAADLSYKDTPYEAPLAPIWSGFYAGGHLGGIRNGGGDLGGHKKWQYLDCFWRAVEFGKKKKKKKWQNICEKKWTDWQETDKVKLEDDDDLKLLGGLHVGYNWQAGAKVYGIEADVSFADGLDYLASIRARLGYAIDNFLIYATAGIAVAGFDDKSIKYSIYDRSYGHDFGGEREVGFVVGAGAEYKLASNVSVGLEGLYYGFGDSSDSFEKYAYGKKWKITHDDDNDLFVVRARLTYHFQDAYSEPLK